MKHNIKDFLNERLINKIDEYVDMNLDTETVVSIMSNEFYSFSDELLDDVKKYISFVIWLKDNHKDRTNSFGRFVARIEALTKKEEIAEVVEKKVVKTEAHAEFLEQRRKEQERIDHYSKLIHQQASREKTEVINQELANQIEEIREEVIDKTINNINVDFNEDPTMAQTIDIDDILEDLDDEELEKTVEGLLDETIDVPFKLDEFTDNFDKTIDYSARKEVYENAIEEFELNSDEYSKTFAELDLEEVEEDEFGSTTQIPSILEDLDDEEMLKTILEDLEDEFEELTDNVYTVTQDNNTQTIDEEAIFGEDEFDLDAVTQQFDLDGLSTLSEINFEEVDYDFEDNGTETIDEMSNFSQNDPSLDLEELSRTLNLDSTTEQSLDELITEVEDEITTFFTEDDNLNNTFQDFKDIVNDLTSVKEEVELDEDDEMSSTQDALNFIDELDGKYTIDDELIEFEEDEMSSTVDALAFLDNLEDTDTIDEMSSTQEALDFIDKYTDDYSATMVELTSEEKEFELTIAPKFGQEVILNEVAHKVVGMENREDDYGIDYQVAKLANLETGEIIYAKVKK
ncbi:hypothetical protein [[Acholeplasma] multilocale]|uniref:hypothetical protein n=1 Tax=[Acholeplasma] multilocale TaxID=264638 RepID=UPI00047970F0|nr:hypothetical protein [[Acholeplasma] multilocale]